MITSKRAALNGTELDEIHDRIVIHGIETGDGKEQISAVSSAAGNGQRVTGKRRDSLDVTVKFGIDIPRTDMVARAEALELVNGWASSAANGAFLTVNYKPGRRLRVRLAQAPGEGNLWEWTKDYTIVFRAYEIPYWEDDEAESAEIGTVSMTAAGSFSAGGTAPAVVAVELQNMSGAEIKKVTNITAGVNRMAFDALGLMANETLVIDHGETGLVRIRIRAADGTYRSAMAARTPESADDFAVNPGDNAAGFEAQRACRMTVLWRCRYL